LKLNLGIMNVALEKIYARIPFHVVVLFLVALVLFIVGSSIVYGLIESWTLTDSLYFAVVSISTVGYGDLFPETDAGMVVNLIFTFMSFCGIFTFGRVFVGYLVDYQINSIVLRLRGKKRRPKPLWKALPQRKELTEDKSDGAEVLEAHEELEEERDEQVVSGRDHRVWIHLGLYVLWLLAWTLFFALVEEDDFTVFEALYFGVITSTTIGYGRYVPATNSGKWFCLILTLFGVFFLSFLASSLSRGLLSWIRTMKCTKMKDDPSADQAQETLESLMDLVKSGDRTMTEAEFICSMLVGTDKVTQEEMDKFSADFERLDRDGNGVLNEEDFMVYKQQTMMGDDHPAGNGQAIAMTEIAEDKALIGSGKTDNVESDDDGVGLQE